MAFGLGDAVGHCAWTAAADSRVFVPSSRGQRGTRSSYLASSEKGLKPTGRLSAEISRKRYAA